MIINFSKKQIIKETTNGAIIVEIGEYKLSLQKRFIKNNTFLIDDKKNYWVFKNDVKKEFTGDELKKLLLPYIKLNKEKIQDKTIIQLLKPLWFYERFNGWYIGNINGNDCFKYNITWKDENSNNFTINKPYKHNDLAQNYIITTFKDINSHNNEILKIKESR